jgi:hypothetical protein
MYKSGLPKRLSKFLKLNIASWSIKGPITPFILTPLDLFLSNDLFNSDLNKENVSFQVMAS